MQNGSGQINQYFKLFLTFFIEKFRGFGFITFKNHQLSKKVVSMKHVFQGKKVNLPFLD